MMSCDKLKQTFMSSEEVSFTLLAEMAYNNLLLRHFQLFIFPSVISKPTLPGFDTSFAVLRPETWTGFQTFSALLLV